LPSQVEQHMGESTSELWSFCWRKITNLVLDLVWLRSSKDRPLEKGSLNYVVFVFNVFVHNQGGGLAKDKPELNLVCD